LRLTARMARDGISRWAPKALSSGERDALNKSLKNGRSGVQHLLIFGLH
jgi:hypothetical protein